MGARLREITLIAGLLLKRAQYVVRVTPAFITPSWKLASSCLYGIPGFVHPSGKNELRPLYKFQLR